MKMAATIDPFQTKETHWLKIEIITPQKLCGVGQVRTLHNTVHNS